MGFLPTLRRSSRKTDKPSPEDAPESTPTPSSDAAASTDTDAISSTAAAKRASSPGADADKDREDSAEGRESRQSLQSSRGADSRSGHRSNSGLSMSSMGSGKSSQEPTLSMVPELVNDLATATDTSGDRPARALRMLFALSENSSGASVGSDPQGNRTAMVREADGHLIPVLLDFLRRCARSSSEQYLALLVLNNVSIPSENKRLIGIEHGGAHVLSRLLCEDPSCHLIAIILVNLTFADAEIRKELVSQSHPNSIIHSLVYALWISTRTPSEYSVREGPPVGDDGEILPSKELLAAAVAEGHVDSERSALNNLDFNDGKSLRTSEVIGPNFDLCNQAFPETARWCLCALKNLTRPTRDPTAAESIISSGVVPLILRIATVGGVTLNEPEVATIKNDSDSSGTPVPIEPSSQQVIDQEEGEKANAKGSVENLAPSFVNDPSSWDSNSMQDAALFIILNLAASAPSRSYLREEDAVQVLSLIPEYAAAFVMNNDLETERKILEFQCLKARMALAFLVGSEGHFGQPKSARGKNVVYTTSSDVSVLLVTPSEAELLVELLANTLHQRAKEGAGGYSAATFSLKGALFGIRCLLTNHLNQVTFSRESGPRLNSLLLKALAKHTLEGATSVDAEAAEHASFSLYLQSNYGFRDTFLPSRYGSSLDDPMRSDEFVERVLTSFLRTTTATPASVHAAEQLLLRLDYLKLDGGVPGLPSTDFDIPGRLLSAADEVVVDIRKAGVKPRTDIFSRPILRTRAPKKGNKKAPWENLASIKMFPTALHAVQDLSFGSTRVRHLDAIDDVLIANNIANSANGEKTESYNYWWTWQDAAPEIQKNLERVRSDGTVTNSVKDFISRVTTTSLKGDEGEPFTVFGLSCSTDSMCSQAKD